MNLVDITIIGVVVLIALWGVRNGFKDEVPSFIAFILSLFGSIFLAGKVSGIFSFIGSKILIAIVSFLVLLLVLYFVVRLILAFLIKGVESRSKISLTSRIGGGVIGALKGYLLVGILLMFMVYSQKPFGIKDYMGSKLTLPVLSSHVKIILLISPSDKNISLDSKNLMSFVKEFKEAFNRIFKIDSERK